MTRADRIFLRRANLAAVALVLIVSAVSALTLAVGAS